MAQYPSINDRVFNLWMKFATNTYDRAIHVGITGLNPPSLNDTTYDLQKKICYYTARTVDAAS